MLVKLCGAGMLSKLPNFQTVNPHDHIDWLHAVTSKVVSWDEKPKDNYTNVPVYTPGTVKGYSGKVFNILEWAKSMAKNNSCLVSAKTADGYYSNSDVGYGILALLRYPFQLFVSTVESDIDKVSRTGKEYAAICVADARACFYMPTPPKDLPTALGMVGAPILIPKSQLPNYTLPAYVTVSDVREVSTIACEFPGDRGGLTPALSGEYVNFYSFKEKDVTYIAPEVDASQVVMLTTPYTGSINVGALFAVAPIEVKKKTKIGGYAKTGYKGVTK